MEEGRKETSQNWSSRDAGWDGESRLRGALTKAITWHVEGGWMREGGGPWRRVRESGWGEEVSGVFPGRSKVQGARGKTPNPPQETRVSPR